MAFIGEANVITLAYLPTLRAGAQRHGLELPACRIHAAAIACPAWATQAVEGCWDPCTGNPPDALIVLDDNLVDSAIAGLCTPGPRAAGTLLIHLANFPSAPADWRPLIRLGWDQRAVLDSAFGFLAAKPPRRAPPTDISASVQTERMNDPSMPRSNGP